MSLPQNPTDNSPIQPRGLRAVEAAAYLGVSTNHIWNLARAGKLRPAKIGPRRKVFDIRDLDRLLEESK